MTILNTIIYYDNFDEIEQYCDNIFKMPMTNDLFITITVNKINDNDIKKLDDFAKLYENIIVYYPPKNLGYMNGMICGYSEYKKIKGNKPDYVIMSNTDIEYPDSEFFCKFIKKEYDDNIWVIGPSIYANKRKSYDNPTSYQRRSVKQIKKIIRFTTFPLISGLYVRLSDVKARMHKMPEPSSSFVYEVHGCFFIVKNEFAEQLEKNKYGMLMYSEESYIAEECFKYKKKAFYDKELKVIHNEHSVTGKIKYTKIAKYISTSLKYILEEYYDEKR